MPRIGSELGWLLRSYEWKRRARSSNLRKALEEASTALEHAYRNSPLDAVNASATLPSPTSSPEREKERLLPQRSTRKSTNPVFVTASQQSCLGTTSNSRVGLVAAQDGTSGSHRAGSAAAPTGSSILRSPLGRGSEGSRQAGDRLPSSPHVSTLKPTSDAVDGGPKPILPRDDVFKSTSDVSHSEREGLAGTHSFSKFPQPLEGTKGGSDAPLGVPRPLQEPTGSDTTPDDKGGSGDRADGNGGVNLGNERVNSDTTGTAILEVGINEACHSSLLVQEEIYRRKRRRRVVGDISSALFLARRSADQTTAPPLVAIAARTEPARGVNGELSRSGVSHTSGDWGSPPEIFDSWEPTPTIGTNSAAFLEDTPSEENAAALVSRLHQAYGDGISGTDDAYTTHEQTPKSSGRRTTHQQTRQLNDVRTTSDQTQQRTDICTTRERAQKLSGVRKTREQNHQRNGMCTMPEQTQQINETPHWLKNGRPVLMSLSECSGETADAAEPWRARDRLDTRRVGCGPSKAARHFNAGGTTPDGSDYTPCDRGHPVRMGCFRGEQTDGILVHENISVGSCWDYPSRTNRVKSGSEFVEHADGDKTPSPLPSPPAPHKSTKRRSTSKLRKPLEGNHRAATGCFLQEHQDGDLPQRGPRANQNQSGGFVAHNNGLGKSIDPLVAAVNLDMAPDRVAKAVVLDEMESDPVVTAVDVDMMQSESAVTAVGLDIVPDPVDIAVGRKMQSGLVATSVCLEVTSVKPHDEEDAQPMSVMTVRPQTWHAGSQSPSVGDKSPYKQCSEHVRTPRRRLQEEEETDQALQATTNVSPQHSQHSRRSQASMCAESYDNSGLGARSPCSIRGEGNCSAQHGRQNESRVYAKICASTGLGVFSPTSNEDVRTSSATQDGGKTQSKRFPRKDQPFFQRPGNGGQDDIGATFLPLAQEEPWAAIFPPAQEEESWAGSLGRSKLGDKSDRASKTSGSTAAGEKLRLEEGEAAATVSTNENEKPVVVAPAAFIEPATHDVCHHSVPNDQSMPNRRDVPVERTTQECEVDARDCTVDACISKVDADFGKGDAHRCCATDIAAGESNAKPAVQEQSDGDLGFLQQAPETSSAPEEFQQQLLQLGEMALYDRTQHIQKQATSGAEETPDLAVRELAPLQPPSTAVPRIDATTGEPGAETTEAGKQGGEGETCVADGVAGGSQKCTSYHTPHLNCPDGEKAQSSSPFVESADGGRGYVGPWVMPTAARGNAHIASTTAELRSVALPSPPRHAVALPPPTKNEGKEEGGNNRGLNQHGSVWDVQKESGSNRKLYRDGNVWEVQEEALPFRVKPLPRHVASLPPACDGVKEGVGSNRTLDQGGNVWGLHKEGGSNPKLDRDDNVWEMQEEALACRAAPASEYTGSLSPAGDKVGEEVEGGRGNNRRSDQGGKVFELREQGVSNHRLNHGSTGVRMMGDTRRCVRFRDSWEHPAVVSARRSETTTPDRANGYLFRRSGQPPDWVVRDGEKSAAMAMSVHHGNVRGTQGGCAPRGGFSNGVWEGVCGGADCFNVGGVSTPEGAYPPEVGDDDGATVVPPLSSLPREGMAPFLFAGFANGRRDNAARTFRNPLLAALDVSNPLLGAVIIREADGLR